MKTLLLFLSVSTSLLAQPGEKRYYGLYHAESDSAHSLYYEFYDGERLVSKYTATNIDRYQEVPTSQTYVSRRTYVFPDGKTMAEGTFYAGSPIETFKSYYHNGRQQAQIDFGKKDDLRMPLYLGMLVNYWDSLGTQQIANGNGKCTCEHIPQYDTRWRMSGEVANGVRTGTWTGIRDDGATYTERYDAVGAFAGGEFTHNGKTTPYTEFEQPATPVGGIPAFYKSIQQNMHYPKKARKAGIQGKVFIEFVIERDGSVSNVKTVKGIDPECDAVAEAAVRMSRPWNPGLQRGVPVKQRMVLPLTFRL